VVLPPQEQLSQKVKLNVMNAQEQEDTRVKNKMLCFHKWKETERHLIDAPIKVFKSFHAKNMPNDYLYDTTKIVLTCAKCGDYKIMTEQGKMLK
jgi:hypothetical protein